MTYKFDARFIGFPPIESTPIPVPANIRALPVQPGQLAIAYDNVFGQGEFIFARAGGAIRQYGLCVLTPVWDTATRMYRMDMTEVPNTANLGRALYVSQVSGALTTGQYGWFMRSGVTPINSNASVAADTTFGIVAAGQAGANSAGKQVLGGRVIQAGASTLVKVAVAGVSGETTARLNDVDGVFVGAFVSGTGIGASAVVTAVDQISNEVTLSVANSAAPSGNITFTFNNATIFYNVAAIQNPIAQGAIT